MSFWQYLLPALRTLLLVESYLVINTVSTKLVQTRLHVQRIYIDFGTDRAQQNFLKPVEKNGCDFSWWLLKWESWSHYHIALIILLLPLKIDLFLDSIPQNRRVTHADRRLVVISFVLDCIVFREYSWLTSELICIKKQISLPHLCELLNRKTIIGSLFHCLRLIIGGIGFSILVGFVQNGWCISLNFLLFLRILAFIILWWNLFWSYRIFLLINRLHFLFRDLDFVQYWDAHFLHLITLYGLLFDEVLDFHLQLVRQFWWPKILLNNQRLLEKVSFAIL